MSQHAAELHSLLSLPPSLPPFLPPSLPPPPLPSPLQLVQMPPFSLLGLLYGAAGGLTAALVGRAYSAKQHSRHSIDRVM